MLFGSCCGLVLLICAGSIFLAQFFERKAYLNEVDDIARFNADLDTNFPGTRTLRNLNICNYTANATTDPSPDDDVCGPQNVSFKHSMFRACLMDYFVVHEQKFWLFSGCCCTEEYGTADGLECLSFMYEGVKQWGPPTYYDVTNPWIHSANQQDFSKPAPVDTHTNELLRNVGWLCFSAGILILSVTIYHRCREKRLLQESVPYLPINDGQESGQEEERKYV